MIDISHALLERLAGTAAFKRGVDYHKRELVGDFVSSGRKHQVMVAGSDNYQVTLIHTTQTLEGSCDCPASGNLDFCKHCVAAALKYAEELTKFQQRKAGGLDDRLLAHLQSLPKERLVSELHALIENDPPLFEAWSIRADVALGKVDYKDLRKRITRALPYNRHIFRYEKVRAYFARVDATIELLQQRQPQSEPAQFLALLRYAMQRMVRVLETVDDSGGYRLHAQGELEVLCISTWQQLGWELTQSVDYWFEFFQSPEYDLFHELLPQLMSVAGLEFEQSFNQRVKQAWGVLPALAKQEPGSRGMPAEYSRLHYYLLRQARARNDLGAQIELNEKVALETMDYLHLAELCLEAGKLDDSDHWLTRAESGEGNRNYNTDVFARHRVALLAAQEQFTAAVDLQWQRFDAAPSLAGYRQLLQLAQQTPRQRHWQQQAQQRVRKSVAPAKGRGMSNMAADLFACMLLEDGDTEAALEFAEAQQVGASILIKIADANTDKPQRAVGLYQRAVELTIEVASNARYQQAIQILVDAQQTLGAAADDAWPLALAELRQTHKQKRNFVKFLADSSLGQRFPASPG